MEDRSNAPFRRGPERRVLQQPSVSEKRLGSRRTRDVSWIPLFRDADPQAVNQALADCSVLTIDQGAPLLEPGQANETIYIVITGQAMAYLDAVARPTMGILLYAGECIGELSAIDGRPVSALVIATQPSRVLKVSRDVFWDRLMVLPKVARNLRIMLSDRLRRSSELMLAAQREQLELQHLRKELDVARQLQASMLPLQRPLFPDRTEIDACGFMEPTSRVGGDFFDAFFVSDHHLFFCIGDVTGHGVAAALFMARTIGLLRVLSARTLQPDRLLQLLNDALCAGNDTEIYVTLFCGYLDTQSGRMTYSNAGHCAPMLTGEAGITRLPLPRGPLLGAMPGVRYASRRQVLNPRQTLFCFTDGVTEARNGCDQEFTEERCMDILHTSSQLELDVILDTVRYEVREFCGSSLLEDDCTMLAIRRC